MFSYIGTTSGRIAINFRQGAVAATNDSADRFKQELKRFADVSHNNAVKQQYIGQQASNNGFHGVKMRKCLTGFQSLTSLSKRRPPGSRATRTTMPTKQLLKGLGKL
jgi:hypothetical protein